MDNETDQDNKEQLSRRKFIGAFGATAAAVPGVCAFHTAAAQTAGADAFSAVIREDRFTRMFPRLPGFARPSGELERALLEIGKPGGIMDAKDQLDKGPLLLITDPALNVNNPNHAVMTAGATFMGQFIDHDMTFDLSSRLGVPTRPEDSKNSRNPALDLDSVYGGGPTLSPQLYRPRSSLDPYAHIKFRIESGGLFEDLPRNAANTAIIADPRNDEHVILAGLQAAFLLFHNNAVDLAASQLRGGDAAQVFAEARRLTRWHYQWMIIHEFLPLFVGQGMVDDILCNGRRFYRSDVPAMPVEFQGACYRFGHSLVRPSYRLNLRGNNDGGPFFAFIFDPSQEGSSDPDDLRGGVRARRRFVGWQTFFDFKDGEVRPNKRIDTTISTPLFTLPRSAIAGEGGPISLMQRNLLRHVTWSMPSGQAIAGAMRVPALTAGDFSELQPLGQNLQRSTPLQYYILREAFVTTGGRTLGPVGGRIVGEVIIGLMQLNRNSYLRVDPDWTPTIPDRMGRLPGDFRMVDFLTFAGVAPAQRGQ
jgi:hypothetical protein